MREVGITGAANLVAVAFGGDFVRAADQPGIFRGAIFAKLGEQLLKAGVQLTLVAVAMEVQRYVACGRHILVYARGNGWRRRPVREACRQQERPAGAPS